MAVISLLYAMELSILWLDIGHLVIMEWVIMDKIVGATIPTHSLGVAAAMLGLPRTTPRSGILRAALALGKGKTREEALTYVEKRLDGLGMGGSEYVSFKAPAELVEEADANRAFLIRVGLGLAAGMSRDEAETWAHMRVGRPPKAQGQVMA